MITETLLTDIRARFAHVETCPFEGPRVFFENAGGALTLGSVVETSARFAAIPDNQGRANGASQALMDIIARARAAAADFFNAPGGQVILGESGTELLFRLVRTAVTRQARGVVLGSTVEHPASRSAAAHWAEVMGLEHRLVPHDDALGLVTPEAYAAAVTPDVTVATILHTSPVTGMGMDLPAIARAIREVAPEAHIIVDGIQHASHGGIDVAAAGVDGYVISPYKVFSRHGYGVAWVGERLTDLGPEQLHGGPARTWELGTRDTGAYATFSDVVDYFDWLGGQVGGAETRRGRIEDAGRAIRAHEKHLTGAMLHGTGNLKGLAELPGVQVIGGIDNPAREGLVCFWAEGCPAPEIVERLNAEGIRTHTRKADHYSGNILDPLGQDSAVRVSLCHYNSEAEVARFLSVMADVLD
ncbi:MAG: aminotransferase class V-fold PLP-dependent enzyme [Salibaculum sp.]|uniref:aminotransferase class V-fold PLP-dependent enzyme n=1 Tax=Salibaculum sp. TaxID=2855480 RepID=UPI00287072F0|nr:aminotransferase class V-fold PLP-dependent enzyme [Salibaculum sp.]MDR9428218.1 aminotransferase class V-fold PLP-dependent enzyme [Salibaculum sp.]MDR9482717.1 aminotransferase class V-fold PLP-dependent enzyme [Salibaculum sp.]